MECVEELKLPWAAFFAKASPVQGAMVKNRVTIMAARNLREAIMVKHILSYLKNNICDSNISLPLK